MKSPDIEKRLRLAEEFKDWADDGHYHDLLTFEEHIAQMSEVIVLALESPGALAELGMFSAIESFRSKLVIFVASTHYEQSSFIRLGPLKFLENSLDNVAEVFPWMTDGVRSVPDPEWLDQSASEVFEALTERLKPAKNEVPFRSAEWLHVTLLVCDLIWIMSALTITEVTGYLQKMGIEESLVDLRRRLFLLEKLGVIRVVARSNQRFYVSLRSEQFLNFKISPTELDLARLQMDAVAYYERNDKKRHKALVEGRRA